MVTPELARHLTEVSGEIGRQVGVLLTRDGTVQDVVVGDAGRLMLPDVGRLRAGTGRFRGLRLVHTHLDGEPLSEDDLNDLALLRLDLVAMVEVGDDGLPGRVEAAYLDPSMLASSLEDDRPPEDPFLHVEAPSVHELELDFHATIEALEAEFSRVVGSARGTSDAERALIVGVTPDDDGFAETLELARSAGVVLAGTLRQKRRKLHPKTVVGRGKLQEIVLEGMRRGADVVIFDADLRPAQARAFEDATGLKAIDRTQLILDIFAQRARSGDGKIQVELARLRYALPRLTEREAGLSRTGGGIGGRGPGETAMEVGRRRIEKRIRRLEKRVEKLSEQRDVRRQRRQRNRLPVLSIIGYTNAGKSTLLNVLTGSDIAAKDKLFMTLDPTTRRLRHPREADVIVTDTVGFIADLPADLLDAFRATLEELEEADLLLHVIDGADPRLEEKVETVEKLVHDLELPSIPILRVLNKTDLLPAEETEALARRLDAVPVSATERSGLEELIDVAEERVGGFPRVVRRQRHGA